MGEEGICLTHWVGFQWSKARGFKVRVQAHPWPLAGSPGTHLTAVCLSFPTCMGEPTEMIAAKMKVLINTHTGSGGDGWVWYQNPRGLGSQDCQLPKI